MAGEREKLVRFLVEGVLFVGFGVGWGKVFVDFNEGDWGQETTYKYKYLEDLQAGQLFIQPLVKLKKLVEKN